MGEKWKPIVGYEGCFEVSDHGQVRSVERKIKHSIAGHMSRKRSAMMKLFLDRDGCLRLVLCANGDKKCHLVHRLVLTAFAGPPSGYVPCLHIDGDRANNHLTNLEWGAPKHKFDAATVQSIRDRYVDGATQSGLADEFNVHFQTIHRIVHHKTYKTGATQ